MKLIDALNILGLELGTITKTEARKAFGYAAKKYHPDVNPAGHEMMKSVNAAWDAIKAALGNDDSFDADEATHGKSSGINYGEELNDAIILAQSFEGVDIELCGAWLWLTFNGKPSEEIRTAMKAHNFKWARKKAKWYFRPAEWKAANKGKTWDMDKIRETHGSSRPERAYRKALAAA